MMCGGAPSCINTVVVSHHLAWRAEIMDCYNNEAYHWPVMVHVTLPVVWNECTAAISVISESPAYNFLQLDLLDPMTYILAAIDWEDASIAWSTVIITSLSDLKENVERHVCKIPQFMLLSSVEHVISCYQMIADNDGHHIEHCKLL